MSKDPTGRQLKMMLTINQIGTLQQYQQHERCEQPPSLFFYSFAITIINYLSIQIWYEVTPHTVQYSILQSTVDLQPCIFSHIPKMIRFDSSID